MSECADMVAWSVQSSLFDKSGALLPCGLSGLCQGKVQSRAFSQVAMQPEETLPLPTPTAGEKPPRQRKRGVQFYLRVQLLLHRTADLHCHLSEIRLAHSDNLSVTSMGIFRCKLMHAFDVLFCSSCKATITTSFCWKKSDTTTCL